jgi:predicted transcriptional regulator
MKRSKERIYYDVLKVYDRMSLLKYPKGITYLINKANLNMKDAERLSKELKDMNMLNGKYITERGYKFMTIYRQIIQILGED